jgi:Gluconate 2-dehydrogenase subunit 3
MPRDLHVGPLDASRTATLRAFADRLIPTDELGPGALPAGAVEYVGQALAGDYAHLLPANVAGLSSLDATARNRHGAAFADLAAADQDELLSELEAGASAAFFELVRRHVFEGMFGDPGYGGNRDRAGWALLGYDGPQAVWTEAEQRIGTIR